MRILNGFYAIFWRAKDSRVQFHADFPATPYGSAYHAVQAYRCYFPADVICSVRDARGRFVAFKRQGE